MKKFVLIPVAAAFLVAAFVLAAYAVKSRQAAEADNLAAQSGAVVVRDHSPRMGSAEARVTIVEFFDPACGTCRAFHPILKGMLREHAGRINLVMRYAPLHPGSDEVVRVLEAARLQDRFWETLEAAYETQNQWTINHVAHPDLFWQAVAPVGLDAQRVSADMRSEAVTRNIQADIDDGQALGVDKTPGFFVNGRPLVEFGERQLRDLVRSELERQY